MRGVSSPKSDVFCHQCQCALRLPESLTESGTITNPKLKLENLATTLVLLQI